MSICYSRLSINFGTSYLFLLIDAFSQRNQWMKNCQLGDIVKSNKSLYLCELHFEKMSFTSFNELKPNAAPTIFNKLEGTYSSKEIIHIKYTCYKKYSTYCRRAKETQGRKYTGNWIFQMSTAKTEEVGRGFP